jgi:hypothetical protein
LRTATKLATFTVVAAIAFGAAWAVGAAVGPIDNGSDTSHSSHEAPTNAGDLPRGLAVAEAGYRFVAESTTFASHTPAEFAFRIVDDEGIAVTTFQELHERSLHLIVLSRNLVDYWHLHPAMDSAGEWRVELPALAAGSYRVFADFQPVGAANLTLGTDIIVPGDVPTVVVPDPLTVTTIDDYTVTLTATPAIGDNELSFVVERNGVAVTTDPYLGAAGHLIAIRAGDLAFLHVHPHTGDSSVITFTGELPTAGNYRLFFDFSHGGVVRTAAFTVVVGEAMSPTTTHEGH